jgi:hypothetical protein
MLAPSDVVSSAAVRSSPTSAVPETVGSGSAVAVDATSAVASEVEEMVPVDV